jgi:60 kDa SS-A/Ro ribonucleoprotein
MNLNTFLRHGVFNDSKLVKSIADKLANPVMIKKSKAFPYQLFTAFQNIDAGVPNSISNALQKAAEVSVDNVPAIEGKVYVMVDVSGSMGSPATGNRVGSVSSKMRCVDVAALVASSFLRKNPDNTVIMPFDTRVHHVKLNPLDSVMTNAATLAKFGGGGTDCSLPLAELNASKAKGDVVIYVSDNESWADRGYGSKTGLMAEWVEFKKRNPKAKLVCIDINPSSTSQVDD